jgi:hypothetical protein
MKTYAPTGEAGDLTWVDEYPESINENWFYFRWPHPETEEDRTPPTHRQRRVGDHLEIQSAQGDRWIPVKYLSLVKIPLMEME